jgi:hypothetical protein
VRLEGEVWSRYFRGFTSSALRLELHHYGSVVLVGRVTRWFLVLQLRAKRVGTAFWRSGM